MADQDEPVTDASAEKAFEAAAAAASEKTPPAKAEPVEVPAPKAEAPAPAAAKAPKAAPEEIFYLTALNEKNK